MFEGGSAPPLLSGMRWSIWYTPSSRAQLFKRFGNLGRRTALLPTFPKQEVDAGARG
jgi:hypothetical protein